MILPPGAVQTNSERAVREGNLLRVSTSLLDSSITSIFEIESLCNSPIHVGRTEKMKILGNNSGFSRREGGEDTLLNSQEISWLEAPLSIVFVLEGACDLELET